jgi:hypothetical protein
LKKLKGPATNKKYMHHKLIVFGIVLAVVIIFGTLFWTDLAINQEELANTPLGDETQSQPKVQSPDSYEDMEKDLNETDLEVDSDSAQMESELQGL